MERRDWFALMGLSLLWGGSFPLIEIGLTGFGPLTLVLLRVSISALALWIFLAIKQGWPLRRAQAPGLLMMGFLNGALPFSLLTTAQGQISGGLAAVLNATTPLFTMVVAHFLTSDDKITAQKMIGLLLGVAGVFVMMLHSHMGGDAFAMLLCLGAACSYGFAGVWGQRLTRQGLRPETIAFGQVLGATLLLSPIAFAIERPLVIPPPNFHAWVAVISLALLSTVTALLIFFRLLKRVGPTRASVVTFLVPVSATALGAVFLQERLEWNQWAGFALILMGLAAINSRVSWTRSR